MTQCLIMRISDHRYGKERVRLTALDRSVSPHHLVVCSVDVSLEGDFEASFTAGDNRKVVATDSMKNTVYVLAREHGVASIEAFASLLANHFFDSYDAVSSACIDIEQQVWRPISSAAGVHGSALVRASAELDLASASRAEDVFDTSSGIDQLQVIKTSKSSFSDFHRDRFTTLKDTEDRLFATTIRVEWHVEDEVPEADAASDLDRRQRVRAELLESFGSHDSRSVQETLHAMGGAVLAAIKEIDSIHLQLPNQHHLLVDLEPLGLDNPNRVFVATDEPFGNIEATLER